MVVREKLLMQKIKKREKMKKQLASTKGPIKAVATSPVGECLLRLWPKTHASDVNCQKPQWSLNFMLIWL